MEVIVYRARQLDESVAAEVARLRAELPDHAVAIVAYRHDYTPADSDPAKNLFCYGRQDLETLPYSGKLRDIDFRNPTGHHDLPVLKYFRDHPDFTTYWVIEDDVRWTGPWNHLVNELGSSSAGLLATTVQSQVENPTWHWWSSLNPARDRVPELIKFFGPFFRASFACVAAVDEKYRAGWSGHFEVTWPTICHAHGLDVQDIGGTGTFTPARWRNRFYCNSPGSWHLAPGTFLWRPTFHGADFKTFAREFSERPYLWHPVKK